MKPTSASTMNFKAEMKTLKSFHIASARMFRNSISNALLYTFQIEGKSKKAKKTRLKEQSSARHSKYIIEHL